MMEIYKKNLHPLFPFCMDVRDFLKMPECVMNRVTVRMSGEERKQYETLREQLILQLAEKL